MDIFFQSKASTHRRGLEVIAKEQEAVLQNSASNFENAMEELEEAIRKKKDATKHK